MSADLLIGRQRSNWSKREAVAGAGSLPLDNAHPSETSRRRVHQIARDLSPRPRFQAPSLRLMDAIRVLRSPMNASAVVVAPAVDRRAYRMTWIDMLRGLVIVLMALDHVRDYMMVGGAVAELSAVTQRQAHIHKGRQLPLAAHGLICRNWILTSRASGLEIPLPWPLRCPTCQAAPNPETGQCADESRRDAL